MEKLAKELLGLFAVIIIGEIRKLETKQPVGT
jgi:hypothetical protein